MMTPMGWVTSMTRGQGKSKDTNDTGGRVDSEVLTPIRNPAAAGRVVVRFNGTKAVMHCQGLTSAETQLLGRVFFVTIENGGGWSLAAADHPAPLTRIESDQPGARPSGNSQAGSGEESWRIPRDPEWYPSTGGDTLTWGATEVRFSTNGPSSVRLVATGARRPAVLPAAFAACASRALAWQEIALLHGASFVAGGRCVLVAGPRCAGKSTVAAAALAASREVLSDDSVLCWLEGGVPTLAPFRRFLSFRERTLTALPAAARDRLHCFHGQEGDRWLLEIEPALAWAGHPLAALWHTRVDEDAGASVIKRLDDGRALAGLLNSVSVLFMTSRYPVEAKALTRVLVGTVEQTPAFEVVLGRDLLLDPARTLERLVEVSL